jgi:cell wall-associated NlpC family hydrolase
LVKVAAQRRLVPVVLVVVAAAIAAFALDRSGAKEPAVHAATATAASPRAPLAGAPPETRDAPGRQTPAAATATVGADAFEGDTLPVDSPYDLPPMLHLAAQGKAGGDAVALGRAVLRSPGLAVSPAARRGIRSARASADALQLLLELGRSESPLLVHAVGGESLRVQATSLEGTRRLVRAINEAGSATITLRPVRRDFADLEQSAAQARASKIGPKVTAIALAQVGIPYSWGGGNARGASTGTCAGYRGSIRPCPATRTVGFDCSGLTLYAYAQVGVTLDHYAAFQWLEGRRIPATDLMPGDLVFFHPKRDGPGHIGMYVGTGRFVHAPRTGDVVKVSNLADYAGSYMGAVRPY